MSRHINWATFGETAKSRFHKKASNTSTDSAEYMNNARTGKIRVTFFYKPTIFMPTPMRYWRINPRSDYNTEIDVKWNSALVTQRLPSKNSSFENNLSPIGCTIIDKWQNDCLMTAWRLTDDCLTTAWRLPDDCLTTAWRLPDDCLTTSWRLPADCRRWGAVCVALSWL